MKRISCLLGQHWYKDKDCSLEMYFMGEEDGYLNYRCINKCVYCGKEKEWYLSLPKIERSEE